jgi:hypothetical protein
MDQLPNSRGEDFSSSCRLDIYSAEFLEFTLSSIVGINKELKKQRLPPEYVQPESAGLSPGNMGHSE